MSSSEINISTKAFIWIHNPYLRFPSTLPKYLSPLPRVIFPKSLQRSLYHHLEGRIGFNTLNPSLSTGKDYPVHSLMMNRMAVLHQNSGVIGKFTPSALEISLGPRVSGNLLGSGWISQNLLCFDGARIFSQILFVCTNYRLILTEPKNRCLI